MNKLVLSIGIVWVLLSLVIGIVIAITPAQPRQTLSSGTQIGYVPEVVSGQASMAPSQSSDDQVRTTVTIADQLTDEQVQHSDFVRASVKVKK